jgi:cytochrome P450
MTEAQLDWDQALYGGAWVAKGRVAVQWALNTPLLSADRTAGWARKAGDPRGRPSALRAVLAQALIFLDGPAHLESRAEAAPAFSVREVLAKKTAISAWASNIAHALPSGGAFDLVDHYARQVPLAVMGHWLETEVPSSPGLWKASAAVARFLEQPSLHRGVAAEAYEALEWFAGSIRTDWPPSQAQVQRLMLLFAGLETTRHLLSLCLLRGLSRPGLWPSLASESVAQDLVHATLRSHPPIRITGRRVTRSHEAFGRRLRRGELVIADLHSAGLPFGSGPHVCLGAALTRIETMAALQALSDHRPRLRLAAEPMASDWLKGPLYNGLTQLWAEDGQGGPLPSP